MALSGVKCYILNFLGADHNCEIDEADKIDCNINMKISSVYLQVYSNLPI
jgi:hypothetical protein